MRYAARFVQIHVRIMRESCEILSENYARFRKVPARFRKILEAKDYIISTLRFTKAVRAAPLSRPFCKRARSTNWLTAG